MNPTIQMKRLVIPALILFLITPFVSSGGGGSTEPAPLKVGVTPNFPPMVSKDGTNIVGVEADFAKALGEELGRPIKFVDVSWEDQVPELLDGKTDIIMSAMSVTVPRQLRVDFATPYLAVGQTVLVRREDANKYAVGFVVAPKTAFGVLKSTTGDFLVQQEFPSCKREAYKTPQDAAKALLRKKIDLLVCDAPTAWWLAGMNEVEGLVVVPVFLTREQMAWAVRKTDPELLKSVNAALEKIQKDGRAAAIIKRWIPLYQ
jgi:polar amino acid transport system substrate-binding protein